MLASLARDEVLKNVYALFLIKKAAFSFHRVYRGLDLNFFISGIGIEVLGLWCGTCLN